MISSGLFVLPAVIFLKAGPAILAAYFLASLFTLPALFSKAELATALPRSGGDYFFIDRSFGSLFGTFTGFAAWFSLSLKSAFALVGIGIFLFPLFPSAGANTVKIIAAVLLLSQSSIAIFMLTALLNFLTASLPSSLGLPQSLPFHFVPPPLPVFPLILSPLFLLFPSNIFSYACLALPPFPSPLPPSSVSSLPFYSSTSRNHPLI